MKLTPGRISLYWCLCPFIGWKGSSISTSWNYINIKVDAIKTWTWEEHSLNTVILTVPLAVMDSQINLSLALVYFVVTFCVSQLFAYDFNNNAFTDTFTFKLLKLLSQSELPLLYTRVHTWTLCRTTICQLNFNLMIPDQQGRAGNKIRPGNSLLDGPPPVNNHEPLL